MIKKQSWELEYDSTEELFKACNRFNSCFSTYKKVRPKFNYEIIPDHKNLSTLVYIEDEVEYDYSERD